MSFEAETAASRYDRDQLHQGVKTVPAPGVEDKRKHRTFDQRSAERQAREYVNRVTGESASGVSDPAVDELWDAANS